MKRLLPVLLLALGAAACDRNPTGARENLKIGETLSLNVNGVDVCDKPTNRQARVVALSEHAAVLADLQNPSNGFTEAEYQVFADEFDRVVWPVVTENFGTPGDVDRNDRILILFTSSVNELTPAGADYIVGGFFFSRDLFPVRDEDGIDGCASSNERELFYLLAPDPSGTINGNTRSKAYVRRTSFGTLAHEFQHLVNASRRLYKNDAPSFEETWLDEGLAHIAEELSFYRASSGLGPRQNVALTTSFFPTQARVDVFDQYQVANFGRVAEYLEEPEVQSPIQDDDDLATRGAAWTFLRYAADHKGGDERQIWQSLANSKLSGIANLTAVLGDPVPLLQNWGVANYTDDAVPGVAPIHTHPSWNFRQVLSNSAFGGFRLRTYNLINGSPNTVSVVAGSQAYMRFRVLPGLRADVRTSTPGTTVGGACTTVPLAVGQVYQGTAAAAAALCFEGGTEGGEYALIPFNGSTSSTARTQLTVTATGVAPVLGPPNPSLSPSGPTLSRAAALEARGDGGWESRLRERERQVLRPLFGRGAPARSASADPAAPEVRISVVRTK
ncbi:MAG TPA: hypothetical protein VF613_13420 [Longimicrobium sp.]|jgi:hypothetical protein